jgi:hypothetical protein
MIQSEASPVPTGGGVGRHDFKSEMDYAGGRQFSAFFKVFGGKLIPSVSNGLRSVSKVGVSV